MGIGHWAPVNVGREDRLVRGCVAFSLLLLGGFALVTSGSISVTAVGFALFAGYSAGTAALGRDPLYARLGIHTRSQAELGPVPDQPEPGSATSGQLDVEHLDA